MVCSVPCRRCEAHVLLVRILLAGMLFSGGACCWARGTADPVRQAMTARGEKLFLGQEAIEATIDGHAQPLPNAAGRCINCHTTDGRASAADPFAPPLNHESLMIRKSRRGAPAFRYDTASFCDTVRTGVDPQYVTLLRAMPRFDLDDTQCLALWMYLTNDDGKGK